MLNFILKKNCFPYLFIIIYIYVCVYVCVCIYIYVYIYMCTHTYIYTHIIYYIHIYKLYIMLQWCKLFQSRFNKYIASVINNICSYTSQKHIGPKPTYCMIIDDVIEEYNVAGRPSQDRQQLLTTVRDIEGMMTKYVEDGETACCTEAGVAEVNDGVRTAMLGRYLVHTAAGGGGHSGQLIHKLYI